MPHDDRAEVRCDLFLKKESRSGQEIGAALASTEAYHCLPQSTRTGSGLQEQDRIGVCQGSSVSPFCSAFGAFKGLHAISADLALWRSAEDVCLGDLIRKTWQS